MACLMAHQLLTHPYLHILHSGATKPQKPLCSGRVSNLKEESKKEQGLKVDFMVQSLERQTLSLRDLGNHI